MKRSELITAIQKHGTEEKGTMLLNIEGREYRVRPSKEGSVIVECDYTGKTEVFENILHLFVSKKTIYETRKARKT